MWKSIIAIKLDTFWKFTPDVEGSFFRLRHINSPKTPIGWIGQAEAIPNTKFLQVFGIQRINGLSNFEILELPKPAIFQTRRLVFRQEPKTPNNWIIEIEVADMPSYSLDDAPLINPSTSSSKTVTTVQVTTTVSKVLSANPNRKGVKFYSADKLKSVYIDTDNVVSVTSAIESVTPNKPVCVPTIPWTGDYYAVSSSGTVSLEIEEYL